MVLPAEFVAVLLGGAYDGGRGALVVAFGQDGLEEEAASSSWRRSRMNIAALITWVITALGGFYMLGTWLSRGGARGGSHLPAPVIFGHFALAAVGLIVWIVYLIADLDVLAWIAFVLLVPVALLGFVMLSRWIPVYRARATTAPGAGEHTATSRSPWSAHTGCSLS